MFKIFTIIALSILSINLSSGQIVADDKLLIDKIEFGYTTRWDIEQIIRNGEYIDNKILNPDHEQDIGKKGWVHKNGLFYPKKGLLFICDEDGEHISNIRFLKPYIGEFGLNTKLKIGSTELGTVFSNIDTFKVGTTLASNYWSFSYDKYVFYIKKHDKTKYKESFNDNLEYYKNQPICIIEIDLKDYSYNNDVVTKGNIPCIKPIYSPKNEMHLNCYEVGWPKSVFWLFIPIYAMTGGNKSEQIKQGYWKEFSPKHLMISEGEYKNGKKVGTFKYYDKYGRLKRTEKYNSFSWTWIIVSIIIVLFSFLILKNKKNAT
jgi:hypothetical protein